MSSTTVTATSATPPQQGRVLASAVSYYNQAAACSHAVLEEALGAHKEFEATAQETIRQHGEQIAEQRLEMDRLRQQVVELNVQRQREASAHAEELSQQRAAAAVDKQMANHRISELEEQVRTSEAAVAAKQSQAQKQQEVNAALRDANARAVQFACPIYQRAIASMQMNLGSYPWERK